MATINGTNGPNQLGGTNNNDVMNGRGGDDLLVGFNGRDQIFGGPGNDTIVPGGGDDRVDGGDGFDLVSYYDSDDGVRVNLVTGLGDGGDAEDDILISIEAVEGSDENDALTGNDGDNSLFGNGDNDVLVGGSGGDYLVGGGAGDDMDGGAGSDYAGYYSSGAAVTVNLTTGTGSGGEATGDRLRGFEHLYGSNGFGDTLTGDANTNFIFGWGGNDRLSGAAGDDVVIGGAGADALNGGAGLDLASYYNAAAAVTVSLTAGGTRGEAAGDRFSGIDDLEGSAFADRLTGDGAENILNGLAGNDALFGAAGDDLLRGAAGGDTIAGGPGLDTASYLESAAGVSVNLTTHVAAGGNAKGDTLASIEDLNGSNFADSLSGDANANVLNGFEGADRLTGQAGDDWLDGGLGADTMAGGAGNDTYAVDALTDAVTELAGQGVDTVESLLNYTLTAELEDLRLFGKAAIGGKGNELANAIFGSEADNFLAGHLGKDLLTGGDGADRFRVFAVGESGVGSKNRDAILDFAQAEGDRIDLERIDAQAGVVGQQAFVFRGAAAFAGVKGQLHQVAAGGNTIVEGDVDGDGAADFQITLVGTFALTANDFVL